MASEPTVLSAAVVRDWAHHARLGLAAARERIDALNVFPVPDGDTGTNLLLTIESATASVDACWVAGRASTAEAARAMATGALLGARGNSGVILSQILRGGAEVLSGADDAVLDGRAVHRLLARGAELAYEAVAHPVEGTILTVIREAAEATAALPGATALGAMDTAVRAAEDALARTPGMLEALRRAGVVDAGGQGLVLVLQALRSALAGAPVPDSPVTEAPAHTGEAPAGVCSTVLAEQPVYRGPAFEVMYLLHADDAAVPALRTTLEALGDSLVVVGGEGLWNVHVHVDDAGAAVEAGIAAGVPHRIRITHLAADLPASAPHDAPRRLVAVAHGPGTRRVLEEAGVVVHSAQARVRPSTAELLGCIDEAHAPEVVLLPSDTDTTAVAEMAAEEARARGVRVAVIPTRSIVQSLAAAAVHDPGATFEEDVIAMTRAAGATRYGAVTIASRAALTTAGPCEAGDVLALVDGDIVAVRDDVEEAVQGILAGMLAIGGDLVTVVFGADDDEDASRRRELVDWIERTFPLAEVIALDGGQPLWPVIVGVE